MRLVQVTCHGSCGLLSCNFCFFFFCQAAAGQEPNKEAYPAANRPNLVALVNGKSGGTPKAYSPPPPFFFYSTKFNRPARGIRLGTKN